MRYGREEGAEKIASTTAGSRAAAADGETLKLKAARKTRRLLGAATLRAELVYFGRDADVQLKGRPKSAARFSRDRTATFCAAGRARERESERFV